MRIALLITLALACACSQEQAGSEQGDGGSVGLNGQSAAYAGSANAGSISAGAGGIDADAGGQPASGAGAGGAAAGGAGVSAAGASTGGTGTPDPPTSKDVVYVGSGAWTNGVGKIHVFQLDTTTGALTPEQELDYGGMVSFMAATPDGKALFATDEVGGKLAAYAISAGSGRLTAINSVPAGGAPVYVSCDRGGKFLFASFYSEGQTRVFPILADGSLATGLEPVPSGDATHAAVIDSSNRFVFVPAKLSDWIAQYAFDETTGELTAATPATVPTAAGAGPRHLVFHPSGRFAYVNNETDRTVSTYSFDATLGTLAEIQPPQDAVAGSGEDWTTSEIALHPSGKFLYVSNRLEVDSTVTLFAIDPVSGHLARVTEFATQGSTPRSIALDRAGTVLIVGNQDSQNIALFRVDPDTGELSLLDTLALAVDPVFIGVFSVPL